MDIRTAPKKVDDSTGFSFLGVDDNELIKINPNDLIKTTSTYAQIKDDISELETALGSESGNRESAVRAEKEAREAADNTLQTNINAEVTRAKNAESDLSTNISNEVTRAKNAESALSEDLIEEMANVESALNTTISNEVTRAKNAESSLSTTISDEITRAESALNTTISNEVTRAKKAESDLSSSIQTSVSSHNTSTTAHDDIRTLISNLTTRVNAVADSEDVDLDQLSEIVAYIKSNRSLIDNVTTSKVSVSDIIDNLTSTSANKPLSANQGRVLNTSITSLTTKLNNHIDSLSNVENKSSETIRSEITKKNVIDALGYTPGTSSTEPITYTLSKSGSKIILTSSNGTETSVTDSDTNTTYSAGTGITLSGTTFSNAGVRSISSGSTNGTISVNTNGTSAEVAVKGLGSAAYTASSAYAAASHTHTKSQITDFPTSLPANGGDADTLDGNHASAFAHLGRDNDLTTRQNEFNFVSSGFSGEIWFNYRTPGNDNGNITKYYLGNGHCGPLGYIIHSGNISEQSVNHAKSAGNADTATSATKATQDESGNNIKASYASSIGISDHTITLKNKNGTSLGTVTVPEFGTTLTSTLSAGSTSLVFSNSVITTSSTIDLYTDKYGVNPTNVVVETGKMTLTFDAQSSAISVKAVIK